MSIGFIKRWWLRIVALILALYFVEDHPSGVFAVIIAAFAIALVLLFVGHALIYFSKKR